MAKKTTKALRCICVKKRLRTLVKQSKQFFTTRPRKLQGRFAVLELWKFNEDTGLRFSESGLKQLISDITNSMAYEQDEGVRKQLLQQIDWLQRITALVGILALCVE